MANSVFGRWRVEGASRENVAYLSDLVAGAMAGMIGGVLFALVAMLYSSYLGMGFWFPMKQIAATLFGVEALIGGGGTTILGLCLHTIAASAFGAIFGLALPAKAHGIVALGLGIAYGFGIWLAMTFGALPFINPTMSARVDMISGWWMAYHLIFGISLGLTPLFRAKDSVLLEYKADSFDRAA